MLFLKAQKTNISLNRIGTVPSQTVAESQEEDQKRFLATIKPPLTWKWSMVDLLFITMSMPEA